MEKGLQPEVLDGIVKNTIESLEKGKKQIFEIANEAKTEWEELESKLETLKNAVRSAVDEVDQLYIAEKESRKKLMTVSKNFKVYTQEDIRKAYDHTKDLQVKLALSKEREQNFKNERFALELRIRKMRSTLERADYLVSHVAVAMNYLMTSLMNISNTLEEMQKRELIGVQVVMAQEEERQRLARDIHDGPAQSLTNVVLKCELCEKYIETDVNLAKQEIKDLKKTVRSTLKDIRDIIYDLRPMSLDDLGLLPTLQGYITKFTHDTDISIEMDSNNLDIELEPVIEVAIFRIIQESLTNVKKHSKTAKAKITIGVVNNHIEVKIIDFGVGFYYERRQKEKINTQFNNGFGIHSMRQRAELLKGKLFIESMLGRGTTVTFLVPVETKKIVG